MVYESVYWSQFWEEVEQDWNLLRICIIVISVALNLYIRLINEGEDWIKFFYIKVLQKYFFHPLNFVVGVTHLFEVFYIVEIYEFDVDKFLLNLQQL